MITDCLPTRVPVDWIICPDGLVTISHLKEMGRIERMISNITNAPKNINRKLDTMNSALWILMDGQNSLRSIIMKMDDRFAEEISPVSERVCKSISDFVELGYVSLLEKSDDLTWDVGPTIGSQQPQHP